MNAPLPLKDIAGRRHLANALRFLAIDAVEAAKSGHPGMPMGMADIAEVLWRDHLKHDPAEPHWADRDRFVLSNGHGSMLLYALLHLTGYDLPLEELKRFRQLHSKTPGHPETGLTPGVETTTGPLGQGLANAVGMALAEKLLAAEFNRPGLPIVDHRTYAFLGDGCLMEGVSHEVCSLAGVWKLGKLVCFYDDNGISIDGHVAGWFADDTAARFRAYGWNVVGPIDGHDAAIVDQAIRIAHTNGDAPTLVICRTTIGWGAPKMAGTHEVHGAPLGADEAKATRAALGWEHGAFDVPVETRAAWDARAQGAARHAVWEALFARYRVQHPAEAAEFERRMLGELPEDWAATARAVLDGARAITAATATRKSSQQALERMVTDLPELLGGSADLTWSNLTAVEASRPLGAAGGNYLHYGVREFGMAAIMNGVSLHRGFIPYGGTFAVFSDYARSGIRMSALMKQRVVYVLTHDSIGLGEDGPTHQPVEHATALRAIPNLEVWRPCDGIETAVAWRSALERDDGPTTLLLSRQNLPQIARDDAMLAGIAAGGYVLSDAVGDAPVAVIIATGSEVAIALDAQKLLATRGIAARVVSMPSTTRFDAQPVAYLRSVLPPKVPRIAVEAGHPDFWRKYVGLEGRVVGIASFGDSAPAAALYEHFGLTANAVADAVAEVVADEAVTTGGQPLAA
jgi:transketolase